MRRVTRLSITALVSAALALVIAGCGMLINSAMADRGNAYEVEFQRPPDEAMNSFVTFLEKQEMEVQSTNGDTTRSAAGNLSTPTSQSGQKVRFKAVAEPTSSGTSLIVISEYMDPASGEWKRVNSDIGVFYSTGDVGNNQSSERSLFKEVRRRLVSNYGGDNVELVSL